jgi:GT2 family glycosyltransferase
VRNERSHIEAALDAALGQDLDRPFEVVVADGMSDDGTRDVLTRRSRQDARLRVFDNLSGGTESGLNIALEASRGRYFIRLDGHTFAPPDYATRLLAHLETGQWDAAGGIKRAVGAGAFGRAVAAAHSSPFGIGNARHHYSSHAGPIDHIPHGAYNLELARRLGGFSVDLVRNQDYDFDRRFAVAGGRILFDPTISLDWQVRSTPRALASQYAQYGYWKFEVLRRHPRSLKARWLAPPALVAGLTASALLAPWRPARLALPVLAGAYAAFAAVGGCTAARRAGPASRGLTGVALATMQLAWGAGFLASALARGSRSASAALAHDRRQRSSEDPDVQAQRPMARIQVVKAHPLVPRRIASSENLPESR